MSLIIGKDLDEISRKAVDALVKAINAAAPSSFSVVLSGGSTPRRLCELLALEPTRSELPWERLHFFFADERCVPPTHQESNYRMAEETFFSKVLVYPEQVHRIKGEEDPERAARGYEVDLASFFCGRPPVFDWIFLGLGADGHTASLFPDSHGLDEARRWVVRTQADRGIKERVTLTLPVLNQAKTVAFLVAGASKAEVVKGVVERKGGKLPAAFIKPQSGDLRWFLDEGAASLLKLK